jgi:hypothetical protein
MKKVFLIVATMAICAGAFAQKKGSDTKGHFSIGPEIGFATGDFNNSHSIGIGATAQGEVNIAQSTNVTLTMGFMSYAGRSYGSGIKYKAAGIIPIKAGVKYFLSEGFYAGAQFGAGFFTNSGGGTAFAYTGMLGYEFNTKSDKAVDVSLKYDGYSKNGGRLGSAGIRLAYRF